VTLKFVVWANLQIDDVLSFCYNDETSKKTARTAAVLRHYYRNCCHLISDFKAKKAPNSISAGTSPQTQLGDLAALHQTPSQPHPRSRPSGPPNKLPPQICIPKSAYALISHSININLRQGTCICLSSSVIRIMVSRKM